MENTIMIEEKTRINGVDLGVTLFGENVKNPVLLFVHGGPGEPEIALLKRYFTPLEKHVTIAYFDQRGTGKSYSPDILPGTMTLEQFVEDTVEVTRRVLQRVNQPKVFLMGHSWGTMLGSYVVQKYPELYYAYLGVGQIGDQYASEAISMGILRKEAQEKKDEEAIKMLKNLKVPQVKDPSQQWIAYFMQQRGLVLKYRPSIFEQYLKDMKNMPYYTEAEKKQWESRTWTNFTWPFLFETLLGTNLKKTIPKQSIPVFIFQGELDLNTVFSEAKEYFDLLEAPVKKLYVFPSAGHSPQFEEFERFQEIFLKEILPLAQGIKEENPGN